MDEVKKIKVGVIGAGLVGGSILKTLDSIASHLYELGACDADKTLEGQIFERGWEWLCDASSVALWSDIIILAVPMNAYEKTLASINKALRLRTWGYPIISDVGSPKKGVVEAFDLFPEIQNTCDIVLGHPMAGTEHHGFQASFDTLFDHKNWVLLNHFSPSTEAFTTIVNLTHHMGARTCVLPVDVHDLAVGKISPVPYALAASAAHMVETSDIKEVALLLSAGSFWDVTRVAGSPIELSQALVASTPEIFVDNIQKTIDVLEQLKICVATGDTLGVENIFSVARQGRKNLVEVKQNDKMFTLETSQENMIETLQKISLGGGAVTNLTKGLSPQHDYTITYINSFKT